MANSSLRNASMLEDLDAEFMRYTDLAKVLMDILKRPRDREICAKYLAQCCAMSASIQSVKENRNIFFRYFLAMLKTATEKQLEFNEAAEREKV